MVQVSYHQTDLDRRRKWENRFQLTRITRQQIQLQNWPELWMFTNAKQHKWRSHNSHLIGPAVEPLNLTLPPPKYCTSPQQGSVSSWLCSCTAGRPTQRPHWPSCPVSPGWSGTLQAHVGDHNTNTYLWSQNKHTFVITTWPKLCPWDSWFRMLTANDACMVYDCWWYASKYVKLQNEI